MTTPPLTSASPAEQPSPAATGPAPISYDDLVAAATVGVGQRAVSLTALPGPADQHSGVIDATDPATALLDAAALIFAARRAAPLPAEIPATTFPKPAPPDTSPELRRAATSMINSVIRDNDPLLLADLLFAAANAGRRAAPQQLPALLDAAARDRSLRPAVAAVLGERGRWLLARHPEWHKFMSAESAPRAADLGDPEIWRTGSRGERREWLAELRRQDPAAARDLLAENWPREPGEVREELIAQLAIGLSAADEPFLESALDDRKASVREAAASLLAVIPESAFSARAIARAARILAVERRGMRRSLAVTLPGAIDEAARRDGITDHPPLGTGIGERAWLATQLIAAVPPRHWQAQLGLSPEELVGTTVQGGFRIDVHAGFRTAAVRTQDAAWAAALLAAGDDKIKGRPPAAWRPDAALAAALDDQARAAWAIGLLKGGDPGQEALAALSEWPGTWPGPLAEAVLAHLDGALARPGQVQRADPLLRPAARKLPASPAIAARLRAQADAAPAGSTLAAETLRAADTINLRHRFAKELS